MKIINEHVVYVNMKGESIPAIGMIARSSQDVAQVDGPDFMSLQYADPSDPGAFRHDLKSMTRYADAVPHFSHPIVKQMFGDDKPANYWMSRAEANYGEISRENALPIPEGLVEGAALTPGVVTGVQAELSAAVVPPPEPGVLAQLDAAGPAPIPPVGQEGIPASEADPA